MFDANKGNKKVADQVDALSDDFAARFTALPARQQQNLMTKFNDMLDDPDSVTAFANGTYAQDSSGAPAKALGSATGNGPVSDDDALQVIMASSKVPQGVKAAILRVITPSDPAFMDVMADGTPKELDAARTERTNAKNAQTAAEDALKNEQDENKSGSLAAQLKAAKASPAPAVPAADSVKKSEVQARVEDLEAAVGGLSAPMGAKVKGKAEVTAVVEELKKLY